MTDGAIPPAAAAKLGVLTRVDGSCGTIALDRPEALNALTTSMVRAIAVALRDFEADAAIELVKIVSTRDDAFCSGGDIRAVRQARLEGRHADADGFFAQEFALNQAIAEFSKPYVALIGGVCMGGGLGLSVHGTHRVVTERVTMAMPEAGIGYFPDVGASHFLNALPGRIGLYLGLTGERLSGADALYCGLATHFVPSTRLRALSDALDHVKAAQTTQTIAAFAVAAPDSKVAENREAIDRCFEAESLDAIVANVRAEQSPFGEGARARLESASPQSLRVIFDLLRRTRDLPLAECLAMELELARALTRSADFIEGVRAMLVDKDRQPRWRLT